MNLLTQINQLEHLTSNEKSLCDYIRNHPMECLSKTPQQLAGDLYLSTSTVYRLLKKLDLKGYSDFKVALWTVVHQKSESAVQDINFPIEAEATPDEILLHLKEVYEYTISDTLELADPYAMAQVAEAMERAERIDIYISAPCLMCCRRSMCRWRCRTRLICRNWRRPIRTRSIFPSSSPLGGAAPRWARSVGCSGSSTRPLRLSHPPIRLRCAAMQIICCISHPTKTIIKRFRPFLPGCR